MNVQDAAIQILKDAGKPLHAKVIAERIIEAGLWSSDGKTPEATVSERTGLNCTTCTGVNCTTDSAL